jgi:hypothetical protein
VTISLALAFFVVMLALVRRLLGRLGRPPLWLVLVVVLLSAWITERIGIQAIFGGFMAGVVMPREHAWRSEIYRRTEPATSNLLLPVFFVVVGLTTRVDLLDSAYLWSMTGLVVLVAVIGKFGSAATAALVSGESVARAAVIGILMNTRGLTEILILTVGLQLRAISPTVFTIMILMALVTTFMAMPALRAFSLLDRARQEERPGDAPVLAAAESLRLSGVRAQAHSVSATCGPSPRLAAWSSTAISHWSNSISALLAATRHLSSWLPGTRIRGMTTTSPPGREPTRSLRTWARSCFVVHLYRSARSRSESCCSTGSEATSAWCWNVSAGCRLSSVN